MVLKVECKLLLKREQLRLASASGLISLLCLQWNFSRREVSRYRQ